MMQWQDFIVTKARLTRVELYLPQLPNGLDGLRIFQFGDLHTWGFRVSEKHLYELLRRESYDLLIVSGDLCYPHSVRFWSSNKVILAYFPVRVLLVCLATTAHHVFDFFDLSKC